ncbi:hypothetical protein M8J77_006061 [Diaphorina citri]|nr:hypothetical protein M8J77_006061 [Diaphorina citri]
MYLLRKKNLGPDAAAYELTLANTRFKKKEEHLITYRSGRTATQIDFWICSNSNALKKNMMDCKVIPGEAVVHQHRLLLLELQLERTSKQKDTAKPVEKIKWFNLPTDSGQQFLEKMKKWFEEHLREMENNNADEMWKEFERTCTTEARSHLGTSKGKLKTEKETWWWNSDVKEAIKKKKEAYKKWAKETNEELKENLRWAYKIEKKISKRIVAKAQDEAKEKLCDELLKPEEPHKIFKIAAQRRERAKAIRAPKYIEDENGKLMTKESDICKRWKEYYEKLLNEGNLKKTSNNEKPRYGPIEAITLEEVVTAVKTSKKGKAVGPDQIPSEFWKMCDEIGRIWLCELLNKMLEGATMPDSFRKSFTLPFFKNKGDSRKCENYRGISLMSHTLKIYERILEKRLRNIVQVDENQCGFVPGKSTTDAIQTVRILVEKYRDSGKDLHMVFIDLEKAFDLVPRELIWESLRAQNTPEEYVRLIQDIYHQSQKQIRCTTGVSSEFLVKYGVHQGSVLSPLLFIVIINHLTKNLMEDLLKTLMFADDIALISDDVEKLQNSLNDWKIALEDNGLKISRKKTEYMFLPFVDASSPPPDILLDGEILPKCEKFRYLGFMIDKEGTCKSDVLNRIQIAWNKFRSMTGVLCDRKMPVKLKGKIYKSVVRPALLYGSECWTMYKTYSNKLSTTETRMLRMSGGVTLKDRIKNIYIRGSFGVRAIEEKLEEKQLRWFGHVKRRPADHMVNKALSINLPRKHTRGRPKHTWWRQQKKRLEESGLSEADTQNRRVYHLRTRRADPNSGD